MNSTSRSAHKHRAIATALSLLLLVLLDGCAARQPARSFSDLQQRVKPGNAVYVIDNTGTEIKGTIVDISSSALTLDADGIRRRMDPDSVRQVQRYGDSLWNGFFIGMAAGTPGILIGDPRYDSCPDDPQRLCANSLVAQRILGFAIMGGIGAGIDALIRGRHQIYLAAGQSLSSAGRVAVSPRVGTSSAAVLVTFRLNNH